MANLTLRYLAVAVAAAFALATGPCTAQQITEQMLIRPVPGGTIDPVALRVATPSYTLTEHSIVASDGTKLHGILLRQPKARGVVLYFGGNGFTVERFGIRTAQIFAPLGLDVMLVDHRGYGMSQGKANVGLLESDGLTAFDYLAKLPHVRRIIVHGQSLGSFTAGYVAAHRKTAGVVLESSITTAEEWAAARGPLVTVAEALKGRGNARFMASISEPLLLLVGKADTTTPAIFSEHLYAASTLPKTRKFLEIVEGAGHNDALPKSGDAYRRFLVTALR